MKFAWIAAAAIALSSTLWAQDDLEKLKQAAAREKQEEMEGLPKRVSDLEKKVAQQKLEDKSTFRVYWGPGLTLETADKNFKLNIGGRLTFEAGVADYSDEDVQRRLSSTHDFEDGMLFRRARFHIAGTIHQNIIFMMDIDFGSTAEDFKDLFIGYGGIPLGFATPDFIVGRIKEPIGFEELTSSRYITFPERSMVTAVFAPAHAAGFTLRDTVAQLDEAITWALGVYKSQNQNADTGAAQGGPGTLTDGRWEFAMRITAAPWYGRDGKEVIHVGGSFRTQNPQGNTSFTARPESRIVTFVGVYGGTGNFAADNVDVNTYLNGELAAVYGPFWLFAELMQAEVTRDSKLNLDDPTFWGWHAAAGFFVTGETRPYKKSSATFDRVKPSKNLGDEGGYGAVEIAFRVSFLDLSSEGVNGNEHWGYNVVINWYLNPSTRVTLSYLIHHSEGTEVNSSNQDIDFGVFWIKFWIDY